MDLDYQEEKARKAVLDAHKAVKEAAKLCLEAGLDGDAIIQTLDECEQNLLFVDSVICD